MVYISGNSDYWAGVDEMDKSVKPSMISDDFALRWPQWTKENKPEDNHPVFGYNRGEVYATNTLIQRYRKTVEDYSPEIEKELNGLIKKAIRAYAKDIKCCRFHDMSQTFTLKIPLIRSLLDSPYFILMVRNPYAWCAHHLNNPREHWRWYNKDLSRTEKLIFACEHWTNSISTAYGDMINHKDSYIIRLEDFLSDPASRFKDILKFVELDFYEDLLPSPLHKVPLGSRSNTKWYPLKKDVNSKYLSTLSQEDIDLIYQFCGKLASMFNYAKPGQ